MKKKSTKNALKQQKTELENKLSDVVSALKSVDGVNPDDVDELLSLKGQLDVEPTRIHIEEKDIVKEYDMGAFRFIRAKSHIIFQDKGGMTLMVSPRMTALYEHLENLLSLKDDYKNLGKDLKKAYDALLTSTVYVLNLPIYATCDDEMFFGIASDIVARLSTMVDKMQEQALKEETFEEDAAFENKEEALDILLKEDKEA